jgi:PAS domain S-box-containing protein
MPAEGVRAALEAPARQEVALIRVRPSLQHPPWEAGNLRYVEAVAFAAETFLRGARLERSIPLVLERLGEAAEASRAYVFECSEVDGVRHWSQRHEWTAPGISRQIDNPILQDRSLAEIGFARWERVLAQGEMVHEARRSFPDSERELLEEQEIRAIAAAPIVVDERWWGFLGLDDCVEERDWSEETLAGLRTVAELLGAAIARRELEERYRCLVEATVEGILVHDEEQILDMNPGLLRMLGYGAGEVIGRDPFDFLVPTSREVAREMARTGSREPYDVELRRKDGTLLPARVTGDTVHYRGRTVRLASLLDLTESRAAEENEKRLLLERLARERAEEAERRAEFLAAVSRALASSFDCSTTLAQVAHLAVPYLCDACTLEVCEEDLSCHRVSAGPVHAEPPAPDDPSALHLPIRARERILGTITLSSPDSGRIFSAEDRVLAQELAERAGSALEHARLYHAAQRATRARDEVLAVVVHDLRNPIGAIVSAATMMLEGGNPELVPRLADIVKRASERMNVLVQDLLEVSRLESGRLSLELRKVEAAELLTEAVSVLAPLGAPREVILRVEIGEPVPPLHADPGRILQVLGNLVGNAIKFSAPGTEVVLRCRLAEGEVHFAVEDRGEGIAADEIPHLFSAFWQADRGDQRGVGLGLSIAKGIVDAHGGRIWVESEVGVGSTFHFALPAAPPELTPALAEATGAPARGDAAG